jgi:hypothetical protein
LNVGLSVEVSPLARRDIALFFRLFATKELRPCVCVFFRRSVRVCASESSCRVSLSLFSLSLSLILIFALSFFFCLLRCAYTSSPFNPGCVSLRVCVCFRECVDGVVLTDRVTIWSYSTDGTNTTF